MFGRRCMKIMKIKKSILRKALEAVAIAIDVALMAVCVSGFIYWIYLGFRPLNLG